MVADDDSVCGLGEGVFVVPGFVGANELLVCEGKGRVVFGDERAPFHGDSEELDEVVELRVLAHGCAICDDVEAEPRRCYFG